MKAKDSIQEAIQELNNYDKNIKAQFYASIDGDDPIEGFHQTHHRIRDWIQRLQEIAYEISGCGLCDVKTNTLPVLVNDDVYYIKRRDLPGEAIGIETKNGFRVYKGSFISPSLAPNMYEIVKRLRQENAKLIDPQHRLLADIDFDNAGQAARFVTGKQVNGLEEWKTEKGIPMKMNKNTNEDENNDSLKRPEVIKICETNGVVIKGNFTLAKRNKSGKYYWANPSASYLVQDWWVLLNDDVERQLHIFCVPANSISADEMWLRKDRPNFIDMQIVYGKESFQDSRSGVEFAKWRIKSLKY